MDKTFYDESNTGLFSFVMMEWKIFTLCCVINE